MIKESEGLMNGIIDTKAGKPEEILSYIEKAYLAWYKTQAETEMPNVIDGSWLSNIKRLWSRRAPGNTCMTSLENISRGIEIRNDSKGCGGVMRVAPIGIFNAAHPHIYKYEDTAHLAGWAAEITHHHIASTFASALMATTVENCIQEERVDQTIFGWIIDGGLSLLNRYFPGHEEELRGFISMMKRAMELGKGEVAERDAIRELGEGWVGDEVLSLFGGGRSYRWKSAPAGAW